METIVTSCNDRDPWRVRICGTCGEPYRPKTGSWRKADTSEFCSRSCVARNPRVKARRMKTMGARRGRANGYGRPGVPGAVLCRCSACQAGRTSDRSALVAKVAREKGVPVSTGAPSKPWTQEQFAERLALVRK